MDYVTCRAIRDRMEELGLTQTDVDKKLDIDRRTVYRLLHGFNIRMDTMLDILSVLGLSVSVSVEE